MLKEQGRNKFKIDETLRHEVAPVESNSILYTTHYQYHGLDIFLAVEMGLLSTFSFAKVLSIFYLVGVFSALCLVGVFVSLVGVGYRSVFL